MAASPGDVAYDAALDSPLTRILRVHFLAHRRLLARLLAPPVHTPPPLHQPGGTSPPWCGDGGARALVVSSGAAALATRAGVRAAVLGSPYTSYDATSFVDAPAHPPPSSLEAFFADGGSGQAYATAKLLEELALLEMRPRAAALAAGGGPTVSLSSVSPAGTVLTPTSARFVRWSAIDLLSPDEAAQPIAELLLSPRPPRPPGGAETVVPRWASELYARRGSLDGFLAACLDTPTGPPTSEAVLPPLIRCSGDPHAASACSSAGGEAR